VNLRDGAYEIDAKHARDARNVVSTTRGSIRKRDGSVIFASPAAQLLGLFAGQNPARLIATSASVIYAIDNAGTITSLKTGLSNAPWEWVQAPVQAGQGPFFGSNGVDTPQRWDGAAGATSNWTAVSGTLGKPQYLLYFDSKVWAVDPAAPSDLYWSDLRDPTAWPAANRVRFDPEDGQGITGLGAVGPYILVFKPGKTWIVTDTATGANRRVGGDIGCVSHRSIMQGTQGTYFLSRDHGIVVTDGHSMRRISDLIRPIIDAIVPGQRAQVAAAFFNRHLYVAIPTTGASNDLLLDYDVEQQSWWIHTLACADLAVWEPSSDPQLYASKAAAQLVSRLMVPGQTQDEIPAGGGMGSNFVSYYDMPWLTFGQPYRRKRIREIHFDGSGRISVYVGKNFAKALPLAGDATFDTEAALWATNDGTVWGGADTQVWGGPADIAEAQILNPGVARAWSLRLGNFTADPFEIESVTFSITPRTD
jgi:hypothetical protein